MPIRLVFQFLSAFLLFRFMGTALLSPILLNILRNNEYIKSADSGAETAAAGTGNIGAEEL